MRESFSIFETEGGCHIVTPFAKPDGEAIEIAVYRTKVGRCRITDEFTTSDYLFLNGLNVESSRIMAEETTRLARLHGVTFLDSELFIETDERHEVDALSRLLNAIEAITYLIYRRSHRTHRSFANEVEFFLLENEIGFYSEHAMLGKTLEHTVPLYVNGSHNTVLWPLSTTDTNLMKHRVKELAWTIVDIKDIQPTVRFDAILDDRREANRKVWDDNVISRVLDSHMDRILHWEDRQQWLTTIAPARLT